MVGIIMLRLINSIILIVIMVLFLLCGCFINECLGGKYNREEQFGGWIDVDEDGQNTRQEVLIRDSLVPVGFDFKGNVNFGVWICPYTGTITTIPRKFDIDHVVPLAEAYKSGADHWDNEKRKRYANYLTDPKHLLATTLGSNREKGARDISEWLPLINVKEYIQIWVEIKENWNLCFDEEEIRVIERELPNYDSPDNVCN
jgi:hypothetical protein